MASQPGSQTIVIHILLNISQSKDNQTMKFGQLIEYNKRNIFLQKVCRKWGKETSSTYLCSFCSKWVREKKKMRDVKKTSLRRTLSERLKDVIFEPNVNVLLWTSFVRTFFVRVSTGFAHIWIVIVNAKFVTQRRT